MTRSAARGAGVIGRCRRLCSRPAAASYVTHSAARGAGVVGRCRRLCSRPAAAAYVTRSAARGAGAAVGRAEEQKLKKQGNMEKGKPLTSKNRKQRSMRAVRDPLSLVFPQRQKAKTHYRYNTSKLRRNSLDNFARV